MDESLFLDNAPIKVVIFAGMTVKSYMKTLYVSSSSATKVYVHLEIPEAQELKHRYAVVLVHAAVIQPQRYQNANQGQVPAAKSTIVEIMATPPEIMKNLKYTLKATITHIDAPSGWYYNACNQCTDGLRFCAGNFWCKDHGARIPLPIIVIEVGIKDSTREMQVLAFGTQAERLIGATMEELSVLKDFDKIVLPQPIAELVNTEREFTIGLTTKAIDERVQIFKIFNCYVIRKKKRIAILHANETSSSITISQPIKITLEGIDEQFENTMVPFTESGIETASQTSPTNSQVTRDLFPDESPAKKAKKTLIIDNEALPEENKQINADKRLIKKKGKKKIEE
ncbi:hypothetical protein REPUB_Repub07fG0140400 [Reevesia pubescens]